MAKKKNGKTAVDPILVQIHERLKAARVADVHSATRISLRQLYNMRDKGIGLHSEYGNVKTLREYFGI